MLAGLVIATLIVATSAQNPQPNSTTPGIRSVDDVVALVRSGTSANEVRSAITDASVYLPLQPKRAVELFFSDVPAEVLAAVFATSGNRYPVVTARGRELDLAYDGYRMVGRSGPDGPSILITGFDQTGERLRAPVEAPPPAPEVVVSQPEPAEAQTVRIETSSDIDDRRNGEPPADVSQLGRRSLAYSPALVTPQNQGAPPVVTVTQVPAGSITRAVVTVPFGNPSYFGTGYGAYGSYGFSSTYGPPCAPAWGSPGSVTYEFESSDRSVNRPWRAAPRVVRPRRR